MSTVLDRITVPFVYADGRLAYLDLPVPLVRRDVERLKLALDALCQEAAPQPEEQ